MVVGIMQPYIFPYVGYFQLVKAVDKFVFYDDVNFINRGWINRNNILVNGLEHLFTIPLFKASQNKLIKDINISFPEFEREKFLKKIEFSYKKAPFFKEAFNLILSVVNTQEDSLSRYTANSVEAVAKYLNLKTEFYFSSETSPETKGFDKADRLIAITKSFGSKNYYNALGGAKLYDKEYFASQGIQLNFCKSIETPYKQFDDNFVPNLSIIDVIMFNSAENTVKILNKYVVV